MQSVVKVLASLIAIGLASVGTFSGLKHGLGLFPKGGLQFGFSTFQNCMNHLAYLLVTPFMAKTDKASTSGPSSITEMLRFLEHPG